MAKPHLEKGAVLDGFRLEEVIHKGGMATLWRVSRPDLTLPALMKVPILAGATTRPRSSASRWSR